MIRSDKQRAQFMSDLYDVLAGNDRHITLEEFQNKWLRGCMNVDDSIGIIDIDNCRLEIKDRER